jgi:sugar phosphate isomerase/epimerase
MVFGSPKQRSTIGGLTREQATRNYVEGLRQVAPHAAERGVKILVEALPAGQCDVVGSLEEAAGIVEEIGSPAIQTMFDTHNAVDEVKNHANLVDEYFDVIRHIHVNEMDGRHPGQGDYDFKPVLGVLKQRGYNGWVSLEVFDFSPGAETIARESVDYLRKETERLSE